MFINIFEIITLNFVETSAVADPTAYYNDFWQYAMYYGEVAARAYYTTWSPPEGTAPPEGIVLQDTQLPGIPDAAENKDTSNSETTGEDDPAVTKL